MKFHITSGIPGRSVWLGGLLAVALVITACGAAQAPAKKATGPSLGLIVPHTLTILTTNSYEPMEYVSPSTLKLTGFDISLARAIGAALGLTVRFDVVQFPALIPALQAHDGDMIMSALTITKARESVVHFIPYFQTGQVILVQKGNPDHISTPSDLCGHTVGIELASATQLLLQGYNKTLCSPSNPISLKEYSDATTEALAVTSGAIPAAVDAYFNLRLAVGENPTKLQFGGSPFASIVQGIGVPPANQPLYTAVQRAVLQLMSNGTYHRLLREFGLSIDAIPSTWVKHLPASATSAA